MKLLKSLSKYREYPAFSYSTLSTLDQNPSGIISKDKTFSDAMKMGSIVDIILTNPDDYEKEFYEIKYDKPTATTLKMYEAVISRIDSWNKEKIVKELF